MNKKEVKEIVVAIYHRILETNCNVEDLIVKRNRHETYLINKYNEVNKARPSIKIQKLISGNWNF